MGGLLFIFIACASAFIPTTQERVEYALKMGWSHEPMRTDYIVLHWDFSVPRAEIEKVQTNLPHIVRMDWNRRIYQRMNILKPYYQRHQQARYQCQDEFDDCRAKCQLAPLHFPLDQTTIETDSLIYTCFATQCKECESNAVMSGEVREYIRLKAMNIPKFDRMMIGNYID